MYYIVAITFLLYNLLFLMLTYSYYKMYKYITILEKRINCMKDNNSTRTIYIKEDKAEGTIPLADIGTSTDSGCGTEGTFSTEGSCCTEGTFDTEGGCRGYKIMLITMINNCNDDDINTLINLYIQIISMIKNIYTKFSELYMQKN
jgi:hypothetical protein